MDDDILANLQRHIFYHGTHVECVRRIMRQGFRVWRWHYCPGVGQYADPGYLGSGVYITCNCRQALWFGPTLVRVDIRPGTRLLNAALPPDRKVLDRLRREFGREVLEKPPWKVLPRNKRLTLPELIALVRYHHERTFLPWELVGAREEFHRQLGKHFRTMLVRYGFDGYGSPEDDVGIVVFAGDRLRVREAIGEISESVQFQREYERCRNIGEMRAYFQRHGTARGTELAADIATAQAGVRA